MKRWFSLILIGMMILSGCAQQAEQKENPSSEAEPKEESVQEEELIIGLSKPMPDRVELPEVEEKLKEINDQHSVVLNGLYDIYNRNWDDPMKIDPNKFVVYYQYLRSRFPEVKEEETIIKTDSAKLIGQESLEKVVTAHFDVPVERIREADCYDEQNQGYEMEGIGGGGTFQIVGAQEEGNQLVMEYQLYDADNIPIAFGTLVAEKEGDSWKYRSMTGEEYIASAFEYPASYGKTCQDGIYRISTGKGISAEVNNRTWYGDKLEDIIEFYKEKLKVYNAEGKEYQPDGENSWGYNGSYYQGQAIWIEVVPEGDGYQIFYRVEQPKRQ